MKLANKFTAALVLVIAPTLAVRTVVQTRTAIEREEARVHSEQAQLGDVLHVAVTEIWESEGWEKSLAYLRKVEAQQGDVGIRWVWLEEQSRAEYHPKVELQRVRERRDGMNTIAFDSAEIPGFLVTYRPVQLKDVPLGAIELLRSTEEAEAFIRAEILSQVGISVLSLLVYGLVAAVLGGRLIGRPIDALIKHAKRVGQADFSTISNIRQRDEIGRLGLEMNEMSRRLQAARDRANSEYQARLAIQHQLMHADRLASVGRVTAAIIHDLGTPLNVISGRATMIAEGDVEEDKLQDSARRIAKQAMRISEMIREVLNYARRGNVERQSCSLAALINDVTHLVQPLADKARVTIEVRPPESDLTIHANRTQIRQVLMNLVMNAVQAMPEGGLILILLDEDAEEKMASFSVVDQGVGIPDEAREKIFEPFYTTKDEGEGTGLGLSVCASIVEDHGGRISVQSTVGEGTTFKVALPRAQQEEPS